MTITREDLLVLCNRASAADDAQKDTVEINIDDLVDLLEVYCDYLETQEQQNAELS